MKFNQVYMLEFGVTMINNTPQEIYNFITTLKNPVQFIDSRLDADALCSAIVLYHVFKSHFGVDLTLCYEKTISKRYIDQLEGFIEIPPILENIDPKH